MKTAAIVTTCKGRLEHLKQTLPHNLQQDYEGFTGIIVVDFGCPDGAAEWCKSLNDPRVKPIRINRYPQNWNMSRARNVGINFADADYVLPVDADVFTPPDYVSRMMSRVELCGFDLCSVLTDDGGRNSHCAIRKDAWLWVRGYDESLEGWGYEDNDFYNRLDNAGFSLGMLNNCGLRLIEHDDEMRAKFLKNPDIQQSAAENLTIVQTVEGRQINPRGFGNI